MPLPRYFHLTVRYTPEVSEVTDPTPKSLTVDRLEALLQMQKTDHSAKEYPNAYQMEKPLGMKWIFLHMLEAYYTNTDSGQKFLALVIPKYWKYTVLV